MDVDSADKRIGQSNLPPNAVDALKNLEVCDLKCWDQQQCNKLHICAQYFYSNMCQYIEGDEKSCRFGHDYHSEHNLSVLQQCGLDELHIDELRTSLKSLNKNVQGIQICQQYLKRDRSHKPDGCAALHICSKYLLRSCDEPCDLSHDLLDENCSSILKYYDICLAKDDVTWFRMVFQNLCRDQPFPSRFLMDYRGISEIGSGGFGRVYEVEHFLDKQRYAVKRIILSSDNIGDAHKEAEVLASLIHHDNIVRYHSSWIEDVMPLDLSIQDSEFSYETTSSDSHPAIHTNRYSCLGIEKRGAANSGDQTSTFSGSHDGRSGSEVLCIQMELCQAESDGYSPVAVFKNILLGKDKFELPLLDMYCQMMDAVTYMHSHGIMHRDLKPENIFLVKAGYKVKIGDFGLAKLTYCRDDEAFKHTAYIGTKSYMSPEMKKKKEYDKSTDIYSLGLIALMMFYPLESETEWIHILERTNETKCPPSASNAEDYKLLSDVRPLLVEMLKDDPKERPNAEHIRDQIEEMIKESS